MRKLAIIAAVVIIAPVVTVVLLVASQSPRKPNLAIRFLGYTNSTTGSRMAIFQVNNVDRSSVYAWYSTICIKTTTNTMGGIGGPTPVGLLQRGASKLIAVPPPTNYVAWTVGVRADHDFGAWREIKSFVMYKLIALHLRPRYGNSGFFIEGEWVTDDGASH